MSKLTVRILSLALLAGCSSKSTDPAASGDAGDVDAATSAPSTPAALQAALDAETCSFRVRCGYIGASELSACESELAGSRTKFPPGYDLVEAADGKRVTFDADAAAKCLAAAKVLGCTVDQQIALANECAAVYGAATAVGGACKADGECVGGYCDRGAGAKPTGCAGTCAALLATGGTCDPNAPHCAQSDFCDATTKKCTARAGAGGDCGGTKPKCLPSLFCKGYLAASGGTPATAGKCAGAGAVGDPCGGSIRGDTDCTPGLFCDRSSKTPVCKARLGVGADCASLRACDDGLACAGLVVDLAAGTVTTKGKCAAYLDVTKTCADPAAYVTGCPLDTVCDAATKQCVLYGTLGADCSKTGTNGACAVDLYCDGATSKCAAQVGLGGACTPVAASAASPCQTGSCDATTKRCALACK
jgi:hypothetical protein